MIVKPIFGFGIQLFRFECVELLSRLGLSSGDTPERTLAKAFNLKCRPMGQISSGDVCFLIGPEHEFCNRSVCILADAAGLVRLNDLIEKTGCTEDPSWALDVLTS